MKKTNKQNNNMIFKLLQYGFQASLSYRKIANESFVSAHRFKLPHQHNVKNLLHKICRQINSASELKHVYCYPNLWIVTYVFEYNFLGRGGGGGSTSLLPKRVLYVPLNNFTHWRLQ